MYVVQAKWHGDGNGSLDRGDVLKFTKGFDDLANLNFARFNEKVRAKEPMVKAAFADDQASYLLIPIHTGAQDFGAEPKQDLQDCLDKYNDTADPDAYELLKAKMLKQADVHALIARGTQGALEVALFEWGEAKEPFAVYGQIAASDIASMWKRYYPQIVSQNIRMFLGTDTEVNAGLQNTCLWSRTTFGTSTTGSRWSVARSDRRCSAVEVRIQGISPAMTFASSTGRRPQARSPRLMTVSPKSSSEPACTYGSSPLDPTPPIPLLMASQRQPIHRTALTDRISSRSTQNSTVCAPS
jgi:hypothetical protein